MSEELNFADLMFFLTMFGSELPHILRDRERLRRIASDPRGKLWLEKAVALGIVKIEGDDIIVDWDGLRELREKIREVMEKCLSLLEYS